MPDVSIQSALGVLLNYNGLTNRFIEGSPTYITEGISDSSITSNGTIFSGTNGYLVKTFGNTTLNKYYPEFKITCSGYLRDLRDITKDILYPVYSGNIKYNLSDVGTNKKFKKDDEEYKYKHKRSRLFEDDGDDDSELFEDLEDKFIDAMESLKEKCPEMYHIIKFKLYEMINGPHFTKDLCEEALECVIEDYKVKEAEFEYEESK